MTTTQPASLTLLRTMLAERGLRTYPTMTGGNCTALVVCDAEGGEDGYHVLMTDGNACLPFTADSGEIVACTYVDADDEGTLILDTTDDGTGDSMARIVATIVSNI